MYDTHSSRMYDQTSLAKTTAFGWSNSIALKLGRTEGGRQLELKLALGGDVLAWVIVE
jgi:hypothetical protein